MVIYGINPVVEALRAVHMVQLTAQIPYAALFNNKPGGVSIAL